MAQLILRNAEGHTVGQREILASERYAFYHAWDQRELITFDGTNYRLVTVAWRIPEEHCVCQVVFDSLERMSCGCTVGGCTCD